MKRRWLSRGGMTASHWISRMFSSMATVPTVCCAHSSMSIAKGVMTTV